MQSMSVLPPAAPNPGRTLGTVLRRRAVEQPDDVAYVYVPSSSRATPWSLTYAQLDQRARAVAVRLGSVTAPGSRVMLAFPTGPDFAGALFGCLLAGMVAVPVEVPPLDVRPLDVPSASVPSAEAPSAGDGDAVEAAARACGPEILLTEPHRAFEWKGRLPGGVTVVESDGLSVGAEPAAWLAERWRPVGVMPRSAAYLRHVPGGGFEAAFTHTDILTTLGMLSRTSRLGLDERHLDWLAGVHGLELVWRTLLPVYEGRTSWTAVP